MEEESCRDLVQSLVETDSPQVLALKLLAELSEVNLVTLALGVGYPAQNPMILHCQRQIECFDQLLEYDDGHSIFIV